MPSAYHYPSPHGRMTAPALGQSRWTGGFWADRFALCHRTILPSMRRALEDRSNKARLAYFRIAAGLEEGAHEGTDWSDGDCYKWLEAMAHVYGVARAPDLDRQMDEVIGWIAAAQEADGYLNTQITLNPAKQRWQNVHHHELYNAGHCFTAAAVHLEATGKRNLLAVAVKLADYLCGVFLPTPPALANFGFNPSQIVGLVDLYRVTGERRYLDLAGQFVSNRGSAPDPGFNGDLNQDRVPLREETAAVGHAVTATYLWAGAADVYAETGEAAVLEALGRIWNDVVATKLYLTGAVGADHFSASIRNDPVHEAFGLPHDLPNATAYTETCANIGQGMWAWRMAALTGDARYGDVLEQVLYNSGLSGMSADGTRFCYTNPLRWYGEAHRGMSNDTPERWFTHICYCCPPQVARTIARLHRWAYGLADDAVWVHLYGGSRLQAEVAAGDAGEVARLLLCAAVAEDDAHDVHLRVAGSGVAAGAVDLLEDDARLGNGHATAAVLLRYERGEPAEFGEFPYERFGVRAVLVEGAPVRAVVLLADVTDREADVVQGAGLLFEQHGGIGQGARRCVKRRGSTSMDRIDRIRPRCRPRRVRRCARRRSRGRRAAPLRCADRASGAA